MKMSEAAGRSRRAEKVCDRPPEQLETAAAGVRPESAAAYIADITNELAGMARASRLEILAYLLEIAQMEAANTSRRLARGAVAR